LSWNCRAFMRLAAVPYLITGLCVAPSLLSFARPRTSRDSLAHAGIPVEYRNYADAIE
jgi:hypothetical protein